MANKASEGRGEARGLFEEGPRTTRSRTPLFADSPTDFCCSADHLKDIILPRHWIGSLVCYPFLSGIRIEANLVVDYASKGCGARCDD